MRRGSTALAAEGDSARPRERSSAGTSEVRVTVDHSWVGLRGERRATATQGCSPETRGPAARQPRVSGSTRASVLRARDELAAARVDLDALADLDELRHLDHEARLADGALGD